MIKHHLDNDMIKESTITTEQVKALLSNSSTLVETEGWLNINKEELDRGHKLNKKREKILDKSEMVAISQRKQI